MCVCVRGGGGCGFNSVKNERVIELLVTPDYAIAFLLFCRHFLYSISKPNKEGSPTIDLSTGSNDTDTNPGCQTSGSGAPYQVKLDRVLSRAISAHSHFQPVISERLRSVLRAKLWRMGRQIYPLNSKRREALLDKWKKITWNLALKPAEVRSALIDNQAKLQQDLTKERQLRSELENKVAHLEEENATLQEKQSSMISPSTSDQGQSRKRKARKSWDEYTPRHK